MYLCHNADEVITATDYDPEADLDNPTGSVFCAHGAGFVVLTVALKSRSMRILEVRSRTSGQKPEMGCDAASEGKTG